MSGFHYFFLLLLSKFSFQTTCDIFAVLNTQLFQMLIVFRVLYAAEIQVPRYQNYRGFVIIWDNVIENVAHVKKKYMNILPYSQL